jgi:hypothetical protein
MSKKKKIWSAVIIILLGMGFYIYKMLFPGMNLSPVPNEISNKATLSKDVDERQAKNYPFKEVFFGDLHVHTQLSFDAYIGGAIASPSDAYRFAKGEGLELYGKTVKLQRPLDFAAVTDHAEFLGELYSILNEGEPGHDAFLARYFRTVTQDSVMARKLFNRIRSRPKREKSKHFNFFPGYETTKKAWNLTLQAAEEHYQPGRFTTFAGYEWSMIKNEGHLHRNVIFRDMRVPDYPISAIEAGTPEEFWKSLELFSQKGAKVLAIPHNPNLSRGLMFADTKSDGTPIDKAYAAVRNRYEPLVEMSQVKGSSEVHASFWQNDEFADYENATFLPAQEQNYVRHALKKGLEHEEKLGINPFKYGLIGSTDTHNGTAGNTEENDDFKGNHTRIDRNGNSRRYSEWVLTATEADYGKKVYEAVNPGGLVGVWARSNTRGEIWDGLQSRETYATSGGRIKVRLFGGYGFKNTYTDYEAMVKDGYEKGVPMGSDLKKGNGKPSFIIWAQKDAESANLDRIQVIKGWYKDGKLHEKIYNVVVSDNRKVNSDGSVPDNGATVNMKTGDWDKSKGAVELQTVWTDPDFEPNVRCFYYLRVIELPTARFTLIDQIKEGVKYPKGTQMTVRERAWSSPIWYAPN